MDSQEASHRGSEDYHQASNDQTPPVRRDAALSSLFDRLLAPTTHEISLVSYPSDGKYVCSRSVVCALPLPSLWLVQLS